MRNLKKRWRMSKSFANASFKGEDFTELVRAESDDKGNDGNLGTFGKGRMVPEFEQAAYA